MTDEMEDDELQSLLNQLEDQDQLVDTMESEVDEPPVESEKPLFSEPEVTLRPEETGPPPDGLVATDARRFDAAPQSIIEERAEDIPVDNQLSKYMDRLDDVTEEVLAACRSDRQEAQDVINIYKKAIEDAQQAKHPPARMWVDGLVKAVEVKAGINGNAVKVIEANAKMLAATKAGTMLNQQINIGDGAQLDDVLSQELSEDDEY